MCIWTCCLHLPQHLTQWHNCVTCATWRWHSLVRGQTHTPSLSLFFANAGSSSWSNCGPFRPFLSLVFCHPKKHDSSNAPLLPPFSVPAVVFSSTRPPSVLWHQSVALGHALAASWETHVKMGTGEAGRVGALFPSGCSDLGSRRREKETMGEERQDRVRPVRPHRQVVLVLCVFVNLHLSLICSCAF